VGGGGSALVLSAHFAGAMTGIAWWGLERRLAPGTWLRAATALLVAGAAGIAFAPAWPVVLAAAFGLGVGFGVVVVEINVLLADAFGERAPAMLNLLGATFGAGAVVGPLAIAATGGYRLPFCAGALLAVVALSLTRDLPGAAPAPPEHGRDRTPSGLVGGFVALCALYVGTESGVGGWETTSLLAGGTGAAAAATWTAGYWAAITTGRLLAIPLALRVAPPVLVAGALLAAAAGLGLAHLPGLAPAAYTLTGLALGPVFPTALAWLALAAPGARGDDGHGVRRRQPGRGDRTGGDRPAGGRQHAGGHPDQRARGRARLPGFDPAAAPLGRARPVTAWALSPTGGRGPWSGRR
jgi:hypothetical protein